ncbi:hypothetical protein C8A00DRAFT_47519 [Chaetomidium leptoderma]|uniref:Uncharacterized protein n=1 Tax=Chaetomidium leptoderma TaxID=669021 RepID=A0AAN6VD43_9PEZI|nr:hypothetical protein C8A00DRAFT_47519 [Chaetomidium leptoderma]
MASTPNLGPATQLFTPPESCLKTTTYRALFKGTPVGFTLGTDPDCFPPPTAAPAAPTTGSLRLYSPGVCPLGYKYVMPYTQSVSGQNYDDSVTRYVCCPEFSILMFTSRHRLYFPDRGVDGPCLGETWGVWVATATDSNLPAYTSITTFWDGKYETVTASPILVAWQDKDKEVLAAMAERLQHQHDNPPFWPPAWEAEKAEKKRKEILLAVLVPVGVIFLAVAAWVYWRKRKGRLHRGQIWPFSLRAGKHAEQQDSEESADARSAKPELPADSLRPSHLDNHPPEVVAHELHTEPIPIREADSRRVVPEVDSTPLSSRPQGL